MAVVSGWIARTLAMPIGDRFSAMVSCCGRPAGYEGVYGVVSICILDGAQMQDKTDISGAVDVNDLSSWWWAKGCVVKKGRVGAGGQFGSPFCTSPIRQARSLDGESALVQVRAAIFTRPES